MATLYTCVIIISADSFKRFEVTALVAAPELRLSLACFLQSELQRKINCGKELESGPPEKKTKSRYLVGEWR